jgi:DNA-binding transcriptional LysR family regulator
MRPNKLDLNLLAVFDAIFSEGNLTRAAARMCISQPAMSNALNRLRRVAKDDLFVRDGRGFRPTPVAVELAPIVRRALNLLETGLETTPGLRAGRVQSFSIAGIDYYEVVILPKLIAAIAEQAPGTSIKATTGLSSEMEKPLRFGDIDLLIDYVPLAGPEFKCEVLFMETRVVLMNADPSATDNSISLDEFAARAHVGRAARAGDAGIDDMGTVMAAIGRRWDVRVTINNWLALPAVLSGSTLIGVAPRRIAELYADKFGLVIAPLPVDVRPIPIYMVWHESRDDHHAHRWLRDQLKRACLSL